MKLNQKFAKALYRARTELNYTQDEVAEAVSITKRWYQKLESGIKLPGAVTMLRLILFLNLNIEDFREEVKLIVPVSSNRRKLLLA